MKRFLFLAAAASLAAQPALAQQTIVSSTVKTFDNNTAAPLQSDTAGNLKIVSAATGTTANQVQGNVASGSSDTGTNPVKVGGIAATAVNATTAGQRSDALTSGGLLMAALSVVPYAGAPADANAATVGFISQPNNFGVAMTLAATGYNWNGTQQIATRGDANGTYVVTAPSAAAAVGTVPNATSAVASALVVKASAGTLYGLNVTAGALAGFVMVFNATSAPADGAVTPSRCIPLAATTGIELNYRALPIYFGTGITVVFSTTGCFVKTASATAFISADSK